MLANGIKMNIKSEKLKIIYYTKYHLKKIITVERLPSATTQNADLVVAYKNQTRGALFREEVQAHLLYGR